MSYIKTQVMANVRNYMFWSEAMRMIYSKRGWLLLITFRCARPKYSAVFIFFYLESKHLKRI